jgi:hypothetical protein
MSRPGRIPRTLVDIDDGDDDLDTEFVADRGIYVSADGERQQEELLNVSHKKRKLVPSALDDVLASWTPVPDNEFTEDEPTPSVYAEAEPQGLTVLGKRKEYVSTVSPDLED